MAPLLTPGRRHSSLPLPLAVAGAGITAAFPDVLWGATVPSDCSRTADAVARPSIDPSAAGSGATHFRPAAVLRFITRSHIYSVTWATSPSPWEHPRRRLSLLQRRHRQIILQLAVVRWVGRNILAP